MKESFNPSDEQYKKVEDLPEEEQGKFTDVPEEQGGGFVKKEAMETRDDAEKASVILSGIQDKKVDIRGILRETAVEDYSKTKEEYMHKINTYLEMREAAREGGYRGREIGYDDIYQLLNDMPEGLKSDKEFMLKIGDLWDADFFNDYASEDLKSDKEFMLKFLTTSSSSYAFPMIADEKLRDDEEFALEALKYIKFGTILDSASERLKNDRDFILKALSINKHLSGDSVGNELANDKDFLVKVAKKSNDVMEIVDKKLYGDAEFMLKLITVNPDILKKESDSALIELRKNRDFMLMAVKENGLILKYASDDLRDDPELITEALKQNPEAIQYVPENIRVKVEKMLK